VVRPLACIEFVEFVTDYLDDALDPAEAERFRGHLAECPGCGAYLDQMRTTIRFTGQLAIGGVPESTLSRLMAIFRAMRP